MIKECFDCCEKEEKIIDEGMKQRRLQKLQEDLEKQNMEHQDEDKIILSPGKQQTDEIKYTE